MKELNGRELAGFIKERQRIQVQNMQKKPKLLILRDSDNPVITKYVNLKIKYGEDIGVEVIDVCADDDALRKEVVRANEDLDINGIIIQPVKDDPETELREYIFVAGSGRSFAQNNTVIT